MFEDILKLTLAEADGQRAYADLVKRWTIDRMFTFSGMLESCRYSAEKMDEYGFDESAVETFPADGRTKVGYWTMPLAWDAKAATLKVVSPGNRAGEVLASYPSLPCSLTMWSPPTPKKGLEGEVVCLERGDRDADYKGLSVKGKFILTGLRGASVRNQAIKRGALGVISDTSRHPMEMPDAVDWMNAWTDDPSGWGLTRGEKNIIGFNLSPRTGRSLRALAAKGPVRLHALVDAKVYAGKMPAATGAVKGRTDEEVITLGHGAEQGANDNASGCAVMLEALRTLKALIAAKKLKKPRRGIRMLITWEVYATLAFVEAHRKRFDRTVAGLCLDMVGESQHVLNGPLGVHRSLESNAAYTDTLMVLLAQSLFDRRWPAFRWAVRDFGLTDCVIADPSIGVPTSYLGHGGGSDHNWHTSADTPDKTDPKTLKFGAAYTATFLYFIADAGETEAAWLAEAVSCDYRKRIADESFRRVQELMDAPDAQALARTLDETNRRMAYLGGIGSMAVASVQRLARSRDLDHTVAEASALVGEAVLNEAQHLEELAESLAYDRGWKLKPARAAAASAELRQAEKIIVERTRTGPLAFDGVPASKRRGIDSSRWGGPLITVLYWCDGKRNLADAMELASQELARPLSGILPQIRKCEKLGLLNVRKA